MRLNDNNNYSKNKKKNCSLTLKYIIIGWFLSEALPALVRTITLAQLLNPLRFTADHIDANHTGRVLIRSSRIHIYMHFFTVEGSDKSCKMGPCRNPINILYPFNGTTEID